MRGLLFKDLLHLKRIGFLLSLLVLVLVACPFFPDGAAMFAVFIYFFAGAMMPVLIMQPDEATHWNKYALSMPISVRTLVLSKYVLVTLVDLVGFFLAAAAIIRASGLTGEMTSLDSLLLALATCGLTLLILSVFMPVLFEFGAEKSRLFMGFSGIVPLLFFYIGKQLGIKAPDPHSLRLLAYMAPVFIILTLLVSIIVSIRIACQKEY